jgi:uncharacterized protein YqgC (DUF456 family)
MVHTVTPLEVVGGLAVLVGLLGILVPVLPGGLLILAALLVWTLDTGGPRAWLVLAVASGLILGGAVVKYVVPGRRLQEAGVPATSLWTGGLLGLVGFFVVPVAGLFLGFVLGVYLAEHRRVGAAAAWPSTTAALRAAGLSILIELAAALLAAAAWVVGLVVT